MEKLIVIKASAGTGKTYRLSMEYIKSLLNEVDYSKIVLVTFTKKATAELKDRILEFIHLAISNDKDTIFSIEEFIGRKLTDKDLSILTKTYKSILLDTETLRISTIDAFIKKIFDYYIIPKTKSFKINDVLDKNSEEFYYNLINEIINKDAPLINKIINISFDLEKNYSINSIIKFIECLVNNRYIIEKIECNRLDNISNDNIMIDKIKELIYELEKIEKSSFYADIQKYLDKNIKVTSENFITQYSELYKNFLKKHKLFKGKGEHIDKLNTYYELKFSEINLFIKEKMKYIESEICLDIAPRIYEIYDKMKFESKEFTFSDITYYVLKETEKSNSYIFEDDKLVNHILEEMGGTIDEMYIDEFQDTSLEQFIILTRVLLTTKKTICVGDLKQSIYGWRGGDSQILNNLYPMIKHFNENLEYEEINLDVSYRSKKKIVDFVNVMMQEKIENIDYEYNNFSSHNKEDIGYVYYFEGKIEEIHDNMISKIKEILSKDTDESIGILFRSNKGINEFSNRLDKENIKYIKEVKKGGMLNIPIVYALKELLLFYETNNYIHLLSHLMSEDISYSQKELKEILNNIESIKNRNFNNIKDKYILKIFEWFDKFNNLTFTDNFEFNFIEEYINDGYHTIKLENLNSKNLFEFYYNYLQSENRYEFLMDVENIKPKTINKSKISLITIHSSKGLQYDTVFYIEDTPRNKDMDIIFFNKNFNYNKMKFNNIRLYTNAYKEFTKEFFDPEEDIKKENLNVFYVAITRAKNNMYFFKRVNKNSIDDNEREPFDGTYIYGNKNKENKEDYDFTYLDNYLTKTKKSMMIKRQISKNHTNIEGEYIRKFGLAFHYFLENMKRESEYDYALSLIYEKYGNLIGPNILKDVIDRINLFIVKNKKIFSGDAIFTEYEIYDENNKKYIIDRINIDFKNKKIYIYDYKTGENAQNKEIYKKQLENYKNIIEKEYIDYDIEVEILV